MLEFSRVSKQAIHPAKFLSGGVQMPGDKSISHRYAMLAALAEGTSELRNFAGRPRIATAPLAV